MTGGILVLSIFCFFPRGGRLGELLTARVQRGPSEAARCASTGAHQAAFPPFPPCFYFDPFAILRPYEYQKAAGDWEPMLLGIEPRNCKVCQLGLYRDKTMWRGGWSRCAVCDEFVHYSCLASGKVSFLKARPRICKTCRVAEQQLRQVVLPPSSEPAPVGS